MPQAQLWRYEQILERMISRIVSRTDLSDVTDASVFKHLLAAHARELDEAYYQLDQLRKVWSLRTASGSDLDERIAEVLPYTLRRLSATKAVHAVVFSRTGTSGGVIIPSGSVVATGDGISFETTVQTQILDTQQSSPLTSVIAIEAGASGNVDPNTIVKFGSKIPGVDSVTNPVSVVQRGRDQESNESLRNRALDFAASLARCTVDALEFLAIGIADDQGKQVVFSHLFEDPVNAGTATLYIDDGLGTAEETLLSSPSGVTSELAASSGGEQLITDNGEGLFLTNMIGRDFTVAGASAPNNGTFTILDVPSANTVVIDNAAGIAEAPAATWVVGPEIVTRGLEGPPAGSAVGGEEFLYLDNKPIRSESGLTITSSIRGVLVLGTDVFLNEPSGRLFFDPPLVATEVITATYTYFDGLIAEVQKNVDGDENDRDNYPGFRAGGVRVRVLTPTVVAISIEGTLIFTEEGGAASAALTLAVENSVLDYINNLGISGDVIVNEIIERIMAVDGVLDVLLDTPTTNIPVLDNEIARATSATVNFG